MGIIRMIITLVQSHKVLSSGLFVALLGLASAVTVIVKRSSGTLSSPLRLSTIVRSVYGIGTVTAAHSYHLKLGVVSRIDDLFVKEGDFVTKGESLLKIDGTTYRAPFPGTITALPFKVGENVFTNVSALSLVNLLDRYLVVSLEQQGALRVLKGQKVIMSFDSIRDNSYTGVVESVYSSENSFLARINVSTLPGRILPDMTADVAITLEEKQNAIVIPVEALDDGKVRIKRGRSPMKLLNVKTGIVNGAFAEVISGDVKVGDRVLLKRDTAD